MNSLSTRDLADKLRTLCNENDAAKRLFKSFASRKNDARETHVERAAWLASTDYQTMLGIFKQLEAIGAGLFVVGRHGYPSRIQWNYSIRSIGEIALGEANLPEEVPDDALVDDVGDEEEPTGPRPMRHEFQLREGLKAKFDLPSDLTEKEAERLAQFIKAIPF